MMRAKGNIGRNIEGAMGCQVFGGHQKIARRALCRRLER
jgi:hypothetical protein